MALRKITLDEQRAMACNNINNVTVRENSVSNLLRKNYSPPNFMLTDAGRLMETMKYLFYRYVSENGKTTCEKCASLDGQIFASLQTKVGVNFPPIHPNCKCDVEWIVDERELYYAKLGLDENAIEEIKNSNSVEDILFVENIFYQYSVYFWSKPQEHKVLSALYVLKNNDEKSARTILKDFGFKESKTFGVDYGEIGHIIVAYDLAKQGISVRDEQAKIDKKRNTELTMLIAMMGYRIADALIYGPSTPVYGDLKGFKLDGKGAGGTVANGIPKYPGNNPAIPPSKGFEWRGSGAPTSGKGNWYNPSTGERWNADLGHGNPIGPHWDYQPYKNGPEYRVFPDGRIELK